MHPLLVEGLTDAIGFMAGVLLAWWIGTMLGFDPLAPGSASNSAIGGIVLAGLGGGLGLQVARRWRRARAARREE